MSADAASFHGLVGEAFAQLLQDLSSVVVLTIALSTSWQLAVVIFVLAPLVGVNGYVQVKFNKGFSNDAKAMYEEASQVASDAVRSIRRGIFLCRREISQRLQK